MHVLNCMNFGRNLEVQVEPMGNGPLINTLNTLTTLRGRLL